MRIAFILGEFPTYSETFIMNQIDYLIKIGYEVDIYAISPRIKKSDRKYFNKNGALDKVFYVWPNPEKNFLYKIVNTLKLLFKLILTDRGTSVKLCSFSKYNKRFGQLYAQAIFLALKKNELTDYDIIHAHFGPYGTLGVFFRDVYSLKAKVITTFHGYDLNVIPKKYGYSFYSKLFQRGDSFTVNSTFSFNKLLSLACPKQKIIRIPVGVELSKFTFHEKILMAGEKIRLLTVARLVEVKGIQYAIYAIAKLTPSKYPIKYQIIGDGPQMNNLKLLASELGLEDVIEFLGAKPHKDVLELYKKSHIFILPSIIGEDGAEETQGLVLLEAQACGLPVVSTFAGGIPESVSDGNSGFLVPPKNAQALADKLSFLFDHPELWTQMGRCGRSHIEKNFNIDVLNNLLVSTYMRLIDT